MSVQCILYSSQDRDTCQVGHRLDSRMGLCPDLGEEGAQSAGLLSLGIGIKTCEEQMFCKATQKYFLDFYYHLC